MAKPGIDPDRHDYSANSAKACHPKGHRTHVSNIKGPDHIPYCETPLSASRHAQRLDAGFEGGDHGDGNHADGAWIRVNSAKS